MADIRINSLPSTASSSSSDDFIAIDGATNGTRKLNAYSPTFGGNVVATGTLTVNSTTDSSSKDTGAIITEGGLGVEKSASIGGALTVNGAIISTLGNNTTIFNSASATTGYQVFNLQNTSGRLQFGLEASTGGNLITGSTAYATCLTTIGNKPVQIGVDQALIGSFSSSGLAVTGALSSTGNLTVSGTGNSRIDGNLGLGITPVTSSRRLLQLSDSGAAYVGNMEGVLALTQGSYYNAGSNYYGVTGTAVSQLALSGGGFYFFNAASGTSGNTLSFTQAMTLNASGNLLLGTTTDSANGKLQLATHTTSAGGIGFGTDTALYRTTDGRLALDHIGGNLPDLILRENGSTKLELYTLSGVGYLGTYTAKSLILQTNNTPALTLDSSQNATFAGNLIRNGAAATDRGIQFATSSVTRWFLYEDNVAESGSNAGSNLRLASYTDGGGYLSQIFEITRSSGLTTFNGQVALTTSTPASASATGVTGTITWDSSYIYVCTATNTWKRVAIATW